MPSDFLFAIEVADEPASDGLLADLAAAVFAYAGLAQVTADELNGALRRARAGGTTDGRCQVRFEAEAGTLTIAVSCGGRAAWRTSRPLLWRSPAP